MLGKTDVNGCMSSYAKGSENFMNKCFVIPYSLTLSNPAIVSSQNMSRSREFINDQLTKVTK